MKMQNMLLILLFPIYVFGDSSFRELDISDLISIADTLSIKKTLKSQLLSGSSALYSNSFDIVTYKFSESDLLVSIPMLKKLLSVNGYKRPTNEDFKFIVQKIYKRLIDYGLPSKYLYVNLDNKKDRKLKFYRNDNSIEIHPYSAYLIKNGNFITELYALPEIVNYSKYFPDVAKMEKEMSVKKIDEEGESIKLYKWMDNESLNTKKILKTFIARNLYLFNNDKTKLDWLLRNDTKFMHSLIHTYDFWKDQKHKSWYDNQKEQP